MSSITFLFSSLACITSPLRVNLAQTRYSYSLCNTFSIFVLYPRTWHALCDIRVVLDHNRWHWLWRYYPIDVDVMIFNDIGSMSRYCMYETKCSDRWIGGSRDQETWMMFNLARCIHLAKHSKAHVANTWNKVYYTIRAEMIAMIRVTATVSMQVCKVPLIWIE